MLVNRGFGVRQTIDIEHNDSLIIGHLMENMSIFPFYFKYNMLFNESERLMFPFYVNKWQLHLFSITLSMIQLLTN